MRPGLYPIAILLAFGLSGCVGHRLRAGSDADSSALAEKLSSAERHIDAANTNAAISRVTIGGNTVVASGAIYNQGGDLSLGSSNIIRDGLRCVQIYRDLCVIHTYYRSSRERCAPGYLDDSLKCLLPGPRAPIAVFRDPIFINKPALDRGVTVHGSTQIGASGMNIVTTAEGSGASAITDVGVITGATIQGDTDINAASTAQIALVIGDHSTARADQCTIFEGIYSGGNVNLRCKSTAQSALVIGDGSTASATQGAIGVPKTPTTHSIAAAGIGAVSNTAIHGDIWTIASASNLLTTMNGPATAATQIGVIDRANINGVTTISASLGNIVTIASQTALCGAVRVGVTLNANCQSWLPQEQAAIGIGQQPAAAYGADDAPFIPWPPPPPASMQDVTRYFRMQGRYGDVAAQIRNRLTARGYESVRFFRADDRGFAVTTDLERLDSNGNPASQRWTVGKTGIVGNIFGYFRMLVGGEDSQFRLFTFVVLDGAVQPAGGPVTEAMVDKWRDDGRMALSAARAAIPVTSATRVWLLVYEFDSARSKKQSYVATRQQRPFSFHAKALGLK